MFEEAARQEKTKRASDLIPYWGLREWKNMVRIERIVPMYPFSRDMHKRKIDMADEIFVINVGGYIGSSTRSEIIYAEATGKPENYLFSHR